MIPSTPQIFPFGFGVTAWFSIAAIPTSTAKPNISFFLSLSVSLCPLFLSCICIVPFHCIRRLIGGTPEGNFGFLRGFRFWVGAWIGFYGFGERERGVLVTNEVQLLPWLGIKFRKWGVLLLAIRFTNKEGFIKFGGEATWDFVSTSILYWFSFLNIGFLIMIIWLNVWSQFNLCFNSLYLIVYVSIMFCWKSCGFWTSLFCHYIFLFPSCEIEAFCWLVKDVSFNVMNVALWLRTSRVLMIACLRGLMVNWLFW